MIMKKFLLAFIFCFCFFAVINTYGQGNNVNTYEMILGSDQITEITLISVRNVNGNVSVLSSSDENITIRIDSDDKTLSGVSEEEFFSKLFSVEKKENELCLNVEAPESEGGLFGRDKSIKAPNINISVHIPNRAFDMAIDTVNGEITLNTSIASIDAKSVNGGIHTDDLMGQVNLSTVNGDITLNIKKASGSSKIRTVNGNITANINPEIGLLIDAKNITGKIKLNNLVLNNLNQNKRYLKGVLNKGENSLSLNTVNGNILLNNLVDKI